jgi:DNA polymerase III subunit delta
MVRPAPTTAKPVALIWGEDDFGVKHRARELFQEWSGPATGADPEIVDAAVSNGGEGLKAIARLREALQTLPFFGKEKVVWFRDCNFLADDRVSASQAITEGLAELARELQGFRWSGVRLLVSAGKLDKRRTFYKTLEKLGTVEAFAGLSLDDRDWEAQAGTAARRQFKALGKGISEEALAELVNCVGPNLRQLAGEVEKLALYVGHQPEIGAADIQALVSRNKPARAFALADALGDRDLPRLLRCLDQELWALKTDSKRSEIGLLYGLIAKVRVLLLLKEMVREGWIRADVDPDRLRAQLERVPAGRLPTDRRFNPLAMHPYMLARALPQTRHYSTDELVRAMETLLQCNRQLVQSGLDEALVLQRALVAIVARSGASPPARGAGAGPGGSPGSSR